MFNYGIFMINRLTNFDNEYFTEEKLASSINYVSVSEIEIVAKVHFPKMDAWLSGVH